MQYGKLSGEGFIGSEQELEGFLPVDMGSPSGVLEEGNCWKYEWTSDGTKIYRIWTQEKYVDYSTGPSEAEYATVGQILFGEAD